MRSNVGVMKGSRKSIRKKDFVTKVSREELARMSPMRRAIVKSIMKGQEKLYGFDKKVEKWSKK